MRSLAGIKSRNMISIPLDIPNVATHGVQVNKEGDYIITVTSTKEGAICQHCGRRITKLNGHGREIELRHTPIFGHRVYIRLRPKRYKCPDCDGKTTTQKLEWYENKSPHTKAYDHHLMLQLVNSTVEDVSRKEKVGYDAVDGAIDRCIHVSVNWREYTELKILGIDEVARRKGRKDFIAVITSQQADGRVAVLGVLADRKKKTVRQFLESIPKRLRRTMESVCTDMWDGYVNAAEEFSAEHDEVSIQVVIDRYHVAKTYREDVDTVRKQEFRRLKKELTETEYQEIVKGMMWTTRKNNKDLAPEEREKLNCLFEHSPKLKVAYTFREELTAIFEMRLTQEEGRERLLKWRDKVRRSGLTCFDKFLTTLDNWLNKIANYFTNRLTSGFVEGLNNKIKTMKRRCYGVLRTEAWFQRLYLDLEGYRHFV